jgi:hypothetical protein
LRCPFGCRKAHRRKRSLERSTAYYQTEIGKMKKKQQNGKRRRTPDRTEESEEKKGPKETDDTEELKRTEKTEEPEASAEPEGKEAEEELDFDEDMVEHLRVQTSLLEEREVSREETIEMLKRVMRQHSLASEKRRDYIVRYLKEKEENPP